MMLDEIYEAIKEFRENKKGCPFPIDIIKSNCNLCDLLFPEALYINMVDGDPQCPCDALGIDYVKSEMQRLFP